MGGEGKEGKGSGGKGPAGKGEGSRKSHRLDEPAIVEQLGANISLLLWRLRVRRKRGSPNEEAAIALLLPATNDHEITLRRCSGENLMLLIHNLNATRLDLLNDVLV